MKNDGTYFIQYQMSAGITKNFEPEVIYPFKWNDIELFVHRAPSGLEDGQPIYSKTHWQATQKDTGISLSVESAMAITDAKKKAIEKLEKVGVDRVKEIISKVKGGVK